MNLKTNGKPDKEILEKVRELSDEELWGMVGVFDGCIDCWDDKPEECEYRPIRKKLGLGECYVYEIKTNLERMRKERDIKNEKL